MDNLFVRIMIIMVAFASFSLGLIIGAVMTNEGHIKFNSKQKVVVSTKQDKYQTIEELLEAHP